MYNAIFIYFMYMQYVYDNCYIFRLYENNIYKSFQFIKK